jgi:YHS domain-containing protein
MKKVETKCKNCDTKTDEPCELANYTTKIDGKTYTFCCQIHARQYMKNKAREE